MATRHPLTSWNEKGVQQILPLAVFHYMTFLSHNKSKITRQINKIPSHKKVCCLTQK
jgi:hypothetical protein